LLRDFAKVAALDLLGIASRNLALELAAMKTCLEDDDNAVIPAGDREELMELMQQYHTAAAGRFVREHKKLRSAEKRNYDTEMLKGELREDVKASFEQLKTFYEKMDVGLRSLSDVLDIDMPELPEDEEEELEAVSSVSVKGRDGQIIFLDSPFEEEETRLFYTRLPELRAVVPSSFFGDLPPLDSAAEGKAEGEPEGEGEPELEDAGDGIDLHIDINDINDDDEEEGDMEVEGLEAGDEVDGGEPTLAAEDEAPTTDSEKLEVLLLRLPSCTNQDRMDKWAEEFCYLNSTRSRNRLLNELYHCDFNALECLPHYARLTATLTKCMPDMGPQLVELLDEQFQYLNRKNKSGKRVETKVKNVRFLSELAKFKICPYNKIFKILNHCLKDFNTDTLTQLSHVLECCGRFLFLTPQTHPYLEKILDIMMVKKKKTKKLDMAVEHLIENAFYSCRPPEQSNLAKEVQRTPMQQYTRRLIFVDLGKSTVEKVLRQLRRLPWPDSEDYVVRTLCKLALEKWEEIPCVASVVCGLNTWYQDVGVKTVDTVIDEIWWGLETNNFRLQQKRISMMRLLGELYNYKQVDSQVIFDVLYLLIDYGYPADAWAASMMVAPDQVLLMISVYSTQIELSQ
jgi:regulator of nonsense transcripts 2